MKDARLSGSPSWADLWGRWASLLSCLLLAAGTLVVYGAVTGFEFVNIDDQVYVTGNPHVRLGLTWEGIRWALRSSEAANWHPLTWISHMLDCQCYGLKAGGHHVTSVLLHLANSWLLFALLLRTTQKRGCSLVVAALFAWHPLHVESVAWVAERKDVLSTCFGLCSLLAYATYSQKFRDQNPAPRTSRTSASVLHSPSVFFYLLSLLCFALGLMSKPMLVTLPFVMVLLDYWPLRRLGQPGSDEAKRFQAASWMRLALEKVPFLALAAMSCWLTLRAQSLGGAVITMTDLPLGVRIANVVLSYYRYVGKTLWPGHLAVFYPYQYTGMTGPIWLAGGGLAMVSAVVLWLGRFPYLAVGWLWYVGTLVPVIGLVQVGAQGMADRYSYLPCIGLFILGVFGASEVAARSRYAKAALSVVGGLALAGCLAAAQRQAGFWRNNESLYRHAIAVTKGNYVANNNLGTTLAGRGQWEEATGLYREALLWKPDYTDARCNLAAAYAALKRHPEAIAEYETALRMNPHLTRAHFFLGDEFFAGGDAASAEAHYRAALAMRPDYAEAHYRIGYLLLARNEVEDSIRHYREVVRLRPDWVEVLNNLSWLLASHPEARFRDGKLAVELAARGVALTHTNSPTLLDTFAGALAEAGRMAEAIQAARTAATLAQNTGPERLRREIETHLRCYEQGKPFRESGVLTSKPGPSQPGAQD